MKMITRLFLVVVMGLCAFSPAEGPRKLPPVWVVEKGSLLSIEGSSNVNRFTCAVKEYLQLDTLRWVHDDRTRKLLFRHSAVRVDVMQFDCHHKFITADLRKTLKVSQYPYLLIHFLTIEDLTWVHEGATVRGQVVIELAGMKKLVDMEYKLVREQGDRFRLQGSKHLRFSDFRLEPPRKLAGLIHINEDIRVVFELAFRPLNS